MKFQSLLLSLYFLFNISCGSQYNQKSIIKSAIDEDNELLTKVQKETFNYFWEVAEPNSGMARERIHMDNIY
ncbi:MAG: beta-glucosidase, partial [Flavobacteriaceae bacterium]|nr:beta-glucosidase [Flavobacteriaceae bacterium]